MSCVSATALCGLALQLSDSCGMMLLQLPASLEVVDEDVQLRGAIAGEYVSVALESDWTIDLCGLPRRFCRDSYDHLRRSAGSADRVT
jgi:hypothetical protein